MRLLRLHLFDYRNFRRLDLSPGPNANVFVGANAQGKTNLLEAVYLLATLKELRAETDAQVIRRGVLHEGGMPAARVVGEAETAGGSVKLEVAIVGRDSGGGLLASKTVKVNGVPKRLSDTVGRLTAVLFTAADIDLVSGSPSSRRRYLDITLSQVDRGYVSARARLERVVSQRNSLLKRIREGMGRPEELAFWDDRMAQDGGYMFAVRADALADLSGLAAAAHAALAPGEALRLEYRPRLEGCSSEALPDVSSAADAYRHALRRGASRDIAAGMTLQGPHRDDVAFYLDGEPATGFASRAQQRTIALALRLAEARLLHRRRQDPPLLLLDDILSEMDDDRARSVIDALSAHDQMLVTATNLERFPQEFVERAAVYSVAGGAVSLQSRTAGAIRETGES